MQTIIIALLVFSLLIIVHELGHFIVAKKVGMRVEEFSLGMGPKIIGKTKGETLYSLRIFPIGGFVKVSGEGSEDESLPMDDPRLYPNKSIGERGLFLFAGSFMNFFLGFVLFTLLFSFVGTPYAESVIGDVVENSPASRAGLLAEDRVIAINDIDVNYWDEMVDQVVNSDGQEIEMTVIRNGSELDILVFPEIDPERNVAIIGIIQSEIKWRKTNIFQAIYLSGKRTLEMAALIFVSFIQLLTRRMDTAELASPIRIVQMIGETARYGLMALMSFTALISINLGVLNLFPIPPLDGSKIMLLGIEKVRGKPLDPKKEGMIHLIGFAFLIGIMLLVAYQDIITLNN